MGGYVFNFTVYTLAMSGLICLALYIYKKVMTGGFHAQGSKQLSIEETMSINPRKSLMIVKAGNERFLIASDVDKTTLISKLETHGTKNNDNTENAKTFENALNDIYKNQQTEEINKQALKEGEDKVVKIKENTSDTHKANSEKMPVHLEIITDKNPAAAGLRRNTYTSKNYSKNKKVTLEVGKTKQHGLSTIKEMAAKINEL